MPRSVRWRANAWSEYDRNSIQPPWLVILADLRLRRPKIQRSLRGSTLETITVSAYSSLLLHTDHSPTSAYLLRSRFRPGDYREAVTGGTLGIHWTISALLELKIAFFWNRHGSWRRLVVLHRGCPCLACVATFPPGLTDASHVSILRVT